MARLYADEDFPLPVVEELRRLGHNVRTVQEAGRANQGIDDALTATASLANQFIRVTRPNPATSLEEPRGSKLHAAMQRQPAGCSGSTSRKPRPNY